jgi:tRNA (guanine9-N1)-methyltransferase
LTSQLAYTYSANRNASFPFTLLYTSLNGRTFTRLESMNDAGYKRWTNTEWWQEGYERLWLGPSSTTSAVEPAPTPAASTSEIPVDSNLHPPEPGQPVLSAVTSADKQTVVYLTADSEDELTELKPEETYIIGGICDHNRYKVRL